MDFQLTDEQLMLNYAANDEQAFDVLYQRHKGPVYRYLLKSCNQSTIAQDLFQELWIKLINNKEKYCTEYAFTTWFYTMARNLLIDWYRKSGKQIKDHQPYINDEIPDNNLKEPESVFEKRAMLHQLQQALEVITFEQREVFILRQESNMPFNDIAKVMSCTTEAAKSRYRYAIEKIKNALGVQ